MFSLIIANAASAASYNYDDFANWGGSCQDDTFQQSPIAIDTATMMTGTAVIYLDVTWATDYKYSRASLMTVDAELAKISTDVEIEDGPSGPIAEMKVVLNNGTEEMYKFSGFHTHYGASEHVIDEYETHGSHHLVFQMSSGAEEYAVIEIPFMFDDVYGDDMNFYIHKWCGEDDSVPAIDTIDYCNLSMESETYGGSAVSPLESPNKTFYELMAGGMMFESDMHLNYYGSFTTPPCTGFVQWFPYIGEPLKFKTPENWLYMTSQFPHESGEEGTYRGVQVIRDDTVFATVMADLTMSSEPPMDTDDVEGDGSYMRLGATTAAFLAAFFF